MMVDIHTLNRWPNDRVTTLLRIQHPILLSPMAGIGTVELAAAVSAAGGLGSIGCAGMDVAEVRHELNALRELTSSPVNVNFFCHSEPAPDPTREHMWRTRLTPYYREFGLDPKITLSSVDLPTFDERYCEVVEAMKPEVVSFHFGLPSSGLLGRVKSAGCRILSTATTVAEARWLEERGVDAIIVQGNEAGGHRGTFLAAGVESTASDLGLFALIPQVVDSVDIPVIAAGGIVDARGIVAAFALGAAGVQLGTAYLLCPEAATSSPYRIALRESRPDSTAVTNVFTGRPARALMNRLIREMGPIAPDLPAFPTPMAALAPIRAEAQRRNNADFTPFWAGKGFASIRNVGAGEFTSALAIETLERLHGQSV